MNSSSSSIGSALVMSWDSSSSDSSTTSFLRAAALLDGLVGEIVAIALLVYNDEQSRFRTCLLSNPSVYPQPYPVSTKDAEHVHVTT